MAVSQLNKYLVFLTLSLLVTTVSSAQFPESIYTVPKPEPIKTATVKTTASKAKTKKPSTTKPKPKAKPKHIVPQSDSLSVAERYAQFMQIADTSLRLPQLYAEIDEWIGTPYRYGRDAIKIGTDCSGFVGKVFQHLFNAKLPRSAAGMATAIQPKNREELQEGDIIILSYYGRRNSHVGIYLQNGWFVHASNVYGVTLANLNTAFYLKKYSKGGSVKGLDIKQYMATSITNERPQIEIFEKLPSKLTPISNDKIIN